VLIPVFVLFVLRVEIRFQTRIRIRSSWVFFMGPGSGCKSVIDCATILIAISHVGMKGGNNERGK
jgi:hypothetical protein